MTSGDSPAVARRRVRLALREAREAMSFTQGQVAEAMEWSLSKVMRIESGEVSISINDLRPLLAHLNISDPTLVERLMQDARMSRRRQQWWDQPRYREHLTPAMRQLIQFELEATTIRYYSVTMLPGPLQTPAYAGAILDKWRRELPDADIEVRLEARLRRRSQLLGRPVAPTILALLDESLLYRMMGGVTVLDEQLADLAKRIEEKRMRVRVMPFAMDAPLPMFGSYEIFYLGQDNDEENAVMYRESHTTDEIVDDLANVRRHRGVFDQLWGAALDEEKSAQLINHARKALSVSDEQPSN